MRVRTLAALLSGGLVAAGASADPRGDVSLAAPGACAQPDPQLVTETLHATPPSVAGPPTDDFSPIDLVDGTVAELTGAPQGPLQALLGGVLGVGDMAGAALPAVSSGADGLDPLPLDPSLPPSLDPVPLTPDLPPLDVPKL